MASRYPCTREDDERVLAWLRLSDAGASFAEIAERYDVTRAAVAGAVKRVHDAMEAA